MERKLNPWWREKRSLFFIVAFAVLFCLLITKLFTLQIINNRGFLLIAQTNRVRVEIIEPTRGKIYDRNGFLMVENRPSYTLYALPRIIHQNPHITTHLSDVLGLSPTQINQRVSRYGWFTFQPAVIQRDVEFNHLAILESVRLELPGIDFGFTPKRSYPLPEAVHLLGYVGERPKAEHMAGSNRYGLIGKHGLELIYEEWIGGEPGVRYAQVDAQGRIIGIAEQPAPIEPKHGWDLHINVDDDLQRLSFELMNDRDGAVVAIDPRDGRVLTLLSLPDYDPSLFSGVMPQDVWDELINDPGKPLLNRVLQGQYPPGSTYKMATLAAGFEEGIVDDNFKTDCRGGMQLGQRFFKCWRHEGHGVLDWKGGIAQSCDVFFYTLGLELGIDRMAKYARLFGFGVNTGIDFNVEMPGINPTSRFLDSKYGVGGWTRGQAMNNSIGQGNVLSTPIQLAVFTSAIATGNIVKPVIGDYLVSPEKKDTMFIDTQVSPVKISESTLEKLRISMRAVVNEPRGTALGQKRRDIVIAGKTGTSQNPHGEDHALFVGFAPYEDPVIAVVVVVEHGESGSRTAAPIAGKLMDYYIRNYHPHLLNVVEKEVETIHAVP